MGHGEEIRCMQKLVGRLFITFNILFCIIGVIFIGVGSYVVHKGNSSNYDELLGFLDERDPTHKDNNITPAEGLLVDALAVKGTLLTVGGFLITIGLGTFFLSTCGWLGACKQNTCLLFVFSIVMIVIVFIELVLGIVAAVAVNKVKGGNGVVSLNITKDLMHDAYDAFYGSANDTKQGQATRIVWNLAQKQGDCCGVSYYTDWTNASLVGVKSPNGSYPNSCYPGQDRTKNIKKDGCWTSVTYVLGRLSRILAGTAITFCILEIIGIVISCYLTCTIRRSGQYKEH